MPEVTKVSVVFFGTPFFAAAQLENLVERGYQVKAVVTSADKAAGRGMSLKESAVKQTAVKHGIRVLQPIKLKDEEFISELKTINADLFIVIAFRMMPETVWKLPKLGTFNLHASLLPQYRGAAPINRAIMNGEKATGLTTFLINEAIDEGNILYQKNMTIHDDETAGELHDRMIEEGKKLVTDTIDALASNAVKPIAQQFLLLKNEQKTAPKIFKNDCIIHWNQNGLRIHNQIRGLSPYPAAFTYITSGKTTTEIKIFRGRFEPRSGVENPGSILTDHKTFLKVAVTDGYYWIHELQQSGKKPLIVTDFLRGFRFGHASYAHSIREK